MCIDQRMYFEQLREETEMEEQYETYQFLKEFDEWIKQQSINRKQRRENVQLGKS